MVLSAAESYYSTLFIALDHRFGRQGETTALQIEQQFQDAVDPAVNILLGQDIAFSQCTDRVVCHERAVANIGAQLYERWRRAPFKFGNQATRQLPSSRTLSRTSAKGRNQLFGARRRMAAPGAKRRCRDVRFRAAFRV